MTEFKSLLIESRFRKALTDPSVSVNTCDRAFHLRIDAKEIIISASYEGAPDIWMESLCLMLQELPISKARELNLSHWEKIWGQDQFFWDLKLEVSDQIFFSPLELLHAALDSYQAKDFLYRQESPIICRCFGVREKDIVEFLQTSEERTIEALSQKTNAGMGCRSCVPQLKQLLKIPTEKSSRFYKSRPVADWVMDIDLALRDFPDSKEWKMQVVSMKDSVVMISFSANVSQVKEEEASRKLQGFLAGAVDPDLSFFLSRSWQRLKAFG